MAWRLGGPCSRTFPLLGPHFWFEWCPRPVWRPSLWSSCDWPFQRDKLGSGMRHVADPHSPSGAFAENDSALLLQARCTTDFPHVAYEAWCAFVLEDWPCCFVRTLGLTAKGLRPGPANWQRQACVTDCQIRQYPRTRKPFPRHATGHSVRQICTVVSF